MTQPDMFDRLPFPEKFSRSGTSIVPPTPTEIAERRRDRGMKRAAEHAESVTPGWKEKALGYVRLHAMVNAYLMAEEVRAMAEADGFEPPTDSRAWGAVMRTAQRQGVIVADGFAPANSSNRSAKVRWRSLVVA